jgi:thiol-disulfide isomerase/thioredoxin
MTKTLSVLALFVLLAALSAAAQSGRRIAPSPATDQPAIEATTTESRPQAAPAAPVNNSPATRPGTGLAFVPEAVMTSPLRSLKGEPFRLADFAGRVMVINLWATWCGPCRRELPEFEAVRGDYAGRGVEFVALTYEDPATEGDKVRKFVGQHKLGSRVAYIDRAAARVLMAGRHVIPQTIVIAADGEVVRHMRGYAPVRSVESLREAIDRALEKGR